MAQANAAYYASRNPFHDFITAPEIAQMFGELLGAWAAVVWAQCGAPNPLRLVEAGPGRGTLMADALRAVARVAPDFAAACDVHFIETSPHLRVSQHARVPNATWHEGLATVPPGPAIFLANEFLDALPIRQFERRDGQWGERFVQGGGFVWRAPADISPDLPTGLPDGAILERNEASLAWVTAVSARLAASGGAALILDYGPARSAPGDSLQALRDGRPSDPLADPGTADLTAHVDFQALAAAAAAATAAVWGPVPQGDFLNHLGLAQRTRRLAVANPNRAASLVEAADRLAAPARMGQLFKAMAITQGGPPPPGFEGFRI